MIILNYLSIENDLNNANISEKNKDNKIIILIERFLLKLFLKINH